MSVRFTVVGLGEALFDIFGSDQRLGGAPLNMAVHAHRLLQRRGIGHAAVVSRIGQDALGRELHDQLSERGVDVSFLQTDPDKPTGRVYVTTDDDGKPTGYDIAPDSAWDVIQWDSELESLARDCDALAFGSLPQRSAQSRSAIQRFVGEARRAIKLFDVNLRQSHGQAFYDRNTLRRSCEIATLVKLNDEELSEVASLLALEADPAAIRAAFGLEAVILTRGAEGTVAYTATGMCEGEPAEATAAAGADSVGAGDSCTAAILACRLLGKPWPVTMTLANRVAAFVVGQPGATPELPDDVLNLL